MALTATAAQVAAAGLSAAAALVWLQPTPDLGGRGLRQGSAAPGPLLANGPAPPAWSARFRRPAVALAAVGAAALVGGAAGWLVAALLAVGLDRWTARAQPRSVVAAGRSRTAALPPAVDLLAACLRAGADPQGALAAVVPALPGDLADDLAAVVARTERGATTAEAWEPVPPDLAALARVFVRSAATGAPAADLLDALASDLRSRRRAQWLDDARAVGVKAAAPLGLCFLPGFAVLGVLPVVVGLAGQLW
jgi:Flp pilus assembly protein TadB